MKYDEFIKTLEQRMGVTDREDAETTAVSVLQALADRLTGGEADDLLAQLPEPLKKAIRVTAEADPMRYDEFVERVAVELELPEEEARERVRAVFSVLREAVTPGEFDDVFAQLDGTYAELASV
jgi:uncharacterized protein (DUF2267 family)